MIFVDTVHVSGGDLVGRYANPHGWSWSKATHCPKVLLIVF